MSELLIVTWGLLGLLLRHRFLMNRISINIKGVIITKPIIRLAKIKYQCLFDFRFSSTNSCKFSGFSKIIFFSGLFKLAIVSLISGTLSNKLVISCRTMGLLLMEGIISKSDVAIKW